MALDVERCYPGFLETGCPVGCCGFPPVHRSGALRHHDHHDRVCADDGDGFRQRADFALVLPELALVAAVAAAAADRDADSALAVDCGYDRGRGHDLDHAAVRRVRCVHHVHAADGHGVAGGARRGRDRGHVHVAGDVDGAVADAAGALPGAVSRRRFASFLRLRINCGRNA